MTLYKIQAQIAQILDTGFAVDEETGEVLADESSLDELKMAEEEKLEILCSAIFIIIQKIPYEAWLLPVL